jgi:D-methionine transport system permease protein
MGSNNFQIITKVLLPEAKPSLIVGSAIAITTILGYTPMTYLIAGGGLGQMAIQYGLYRFEADVMYISSILLIVLVQIMQETLNYIAKKSDKRIRGTGKKVRKPNAGAQTSSPHKYKPFG